MSPRRLLLAARLPRRPPPGSLTRAQQLIRQPQIGGRYPQQTRNPQQEADIADLAAPTFDHGHIRLVHLEQLGQRSLSQLVRRPVLA